ncbi:hypothetical protein [Devosia sp. RR2S18]|uniref:hypothetical protein n=1 Tax=Devosia rhizosphaerae TaxID=3049774 RepID=UPI00254151DA|nr:hypothetical protein [Devosia sp. RR2S18]WIJ23789.1 hypothetical protein QOV41_12055 [Devosia sp. RR2S18]
MKTSYREIYGGPEVVSVRQAPMPVPAEGGVVVQVHAATVNRTDCAVRVSARVRRLAVSFSALLTRL